MPSCWKRRFRWRMDRMHLGERPGRVDWDVLPFIGDDVEPVGEARQRLTVVEAAGDQFADLTAAGVGAGSK
jgi:hypothetical protein